jgi:hypothetical protein
METLMNRKLSRRSTALSLFLVSFFIGTAHADDPPPPKPTEPKIEFVRRAYPEKLGSVAIVTEVTKESITIQCDDQKPKRFPVSEALAAGEIPKMPRAKPGVGALSVGNPYMYRLKDVKVGDWVAIFYARVDGVNICDHICIEKRPGGLVPPLPDGVEEPPLPLPKGSPQRIWLRYHDWQNAYWDFEDRGIPYPAKFSIVRYHIAPMPREVKQPAAPKGT